MNLHKMLLEREEIDSPIRVGIIGAGKFTTMFLSQVRDTPGVQVIGVADQEISHIYKAFERVNWPQNCYSATRNLSGSNKGKTYVTDDPRLLITLEQLDVVIDATGDAVAGVSHALACISHGKHIIMVNVEADALAGPLLSSQAQDSGLIYSLAYGDQPALIIEQVDWALASGFDVVAAGKGTKYLPGYHYCLPEDVWINYGIDEQYAERFGLNPRMFNSFLDGTKSAIEMVAVSNATGLKANSDGLQFPPCSVNDLPEKLRPVDEGGILKHEGQVEVVSSIENDGREVPQGLRWGVYVVFKASNNYSATSFKEYGIITDSSGYYAAMYKPFHLIGLELGISIANVVLRKEPTGAPHGFYSDVVATAKRNLKVGEILDGEGGGTVFGKLIPAQKSLEEGYLPIGLASRVRLQRPIVKEEIVRWKDVAINYDSEAVRTRREMEIMYGGL